VAGRTKRGREARGNVIRHTAAERLRALPGRDVATVAIRVRRGEGVVVADVAIRASHNFAGRRELMRARQRPSRRTVVEDRRGPCDCVVTCRAVRRRERCSGRWVGRIVCRLPGR